MSSFAQAKIDLKLAKSPGDKVTLVIKAKGELVVEGATGTWNNGKNSTFTLSSSTISFKGDILELEAKMAKVEKATFTGCTNLTSLNFYFNQLKTIDLSQCPSLKTVSMMFNRLEGTIDLSKNKKLQTFNCAYNQNISELNITGCDDLITLDCNNNKIKKLDLKGKANLGLLSCSFNQLESLNLEDNIKLRGLNCFGNKLKALDLSKNLEIQVLACYRNKISNIDLSKNVNLKMMDIGVNPLSSIDVSPLKNLAVLDVSECELKELNLKSNKELLKVNCHKNNLTSLDLSQNKKIVRISCYSNQIKGKAMTDFISSLRSLDGQVVNTRAAEGEIVVVNGKNPKEGNVCTKSDVEKAKKLDWLVKDFNGKHRDRLDYEGSGDVVVAENTAIVFTTNKKIGDKIQLTISGENVTIKGLEGKFVDGAASTYKLTNSKVEIGGKIQVIDCGIAGITMLDVSKCLTLKSLSCPLNEIRTLDLSKNVNLERILCEYNKLTELNVENCPKLTKVLCYNNLLTKLDFTKNPDLRVLSCGDNKIVDLGISKSFKLEKLACNGNPLKTLKVDIFPELTVLWCGKTGISTIDLSKNPKLNQILCQANPIKTIDFSKNPKLNLVWTSYNLLETIDFSANVNLKEVWCYDNRLKGEGLDKLIASLPSWDIKENAEFIVFNSTSTYEKNECTSEQVKALGKKGWKTFYIEREGTPKKEYTGKGTFVKEILRDDIVFYPNPTTDYLNINTSLRNETIRVFNAMGTCVKIERLNEDGKLSMDVRDLVKGVYILVIKDKCYRFIIR